MFNDPLIGMTASLADIYHLQFEALIIGNVLTPLVNGERELAAIWRDRPPTQMALYHSPGRLTIQHVSSGFFAPINFRHTDLHKKETSLC
jgi:hypothetical protein